MLLSVIPGLILFCRAFMHCLLLKILISDCHALKGGWQMWVQTLQAKENVEIGSQPSQEGFKELFNC